MEGSSFCRTNFLASPRKVSGAKKRSNISQELTVKGSWWLLGYLWHNIQMSRPNTSQDALKFIKKMEEFGFFGGWTEIITHLPCSWDSPLHRILSSWKWWPRTFPYPPTWGPRVVRMEKPRTKKHLQGLQLPEVHTKLRAEHSIFYAPEIHQASRA